MCQFGVKIKPLLKFASFLSVFTFVVCSQFLSSNSEIKHRTRYYFGISLLTQVKPETIQSKITERLPIGSSIDEIYSFIKSSRIGKDRFSICIPQNRSENYNQNVICQIHTNANMISLDFRRVSYDILLKVDHQGRLDDIQVKELVITL